MKVPNINDLIDVYHTNSVERKTAKVLSYHKKNNRIIGLEGVLINNPDVEIYIYTKDLKIWMYRDI